MRNQLFFLLAGCLLLMLACSEQQDPRLFGNWQATQLIENQDTIRVDLQPIQLTFSPTGTYKYQGFLRDQEAGFYTIKGNKLIVLDTLAVDAKDRFVELDWTAWPDSILRIAMKSERGPQLLSLRKMN